MEGRRCAPALLVPIHEFSNAEDYLKYVYMGLFGPSRPKRVTKEEFKKIKQSLYNKLDRRDRAEFEKVFRTDLEESGLQAGITRDEYENTMTWLKENKSKHVLEDGDLMIIVKYFEQHLQD